MKTYNRALDHVTLALAYAAKGNVVKAAKMFSEATKQSDLKRAIATLEASNKQAYTASMKKVVTAGDDIDMGDEEDLDALIGDDVVEDVEEDEEVDAEFDEDDEDEEGDFDGAEFAKVLASLHKPSKAKRK